MPFEMDSTISIHAPREGGDSEMATISGYLTDFNPRPPRGGRLGTTIALSVRKHPISIHAPREGGDTLALNNQRMHNLHFNPRPPRGGRHRDVLFRELPCFHFNPRPPQGGDRRL